MPRAVLAKEVVEVLPRVRTKVAEGRLKLPEAPLDATPSESPLSRESAVDRRVPDDAVASAYEILVRGPGRECQVRLKSALVTEMGIEHVGDMKKLAVQ